jgi:hypothetical protein
MKNWGENEAVCQKEMRQNCPAAIGKNVTISIPFSLKRSVSVLTLFKGRKTAKNLKTVNGSSHNVDISNNTTFRLAFLKLVRQFI